VCFPYVLDFPYAFPYELVHNCDALRTHQTAVGTIKCRRAFSVGRSKSVHTSPVLTGGTLSALRAKPTENKLAFTNNSLAERTRGRFGHVVPLHVLHIGAAVADEVVVQQTFQIEPPGAALDGHFPHQTRLHQVPQIVISCGSGRAGIHAIHSSEDFRRRGMPLVVLQECHHGVALRSTTQPAAVQRPFNRIGVYQ
jgi:hypothetical protein